MKIRIQSKERIAETVAKIIIDLVNQNPKAVLGLATGSSPLGVYENLVKACQNGEVSFKETTTFNLDEYVGLDENNEQSYRYFMNQNLFDHISYHLTLLLIHQE